MSLKRKPTVIKFDREDERQKFLNWALGKSKPSNGLKRAKNAMHLAQRALKTNSQEGELTVPLEEVKVPVRAYSRHSSPSGVLNVSSGRLRSRRKNAKRKRDGAHAFTTNNRRG